LRAAPLSRPTRQLGPELREGAAGRTVTFGAGYNMIGVPSGTAVSADSVLAFDTAANNYTQLGSGDSLSGGRGYWAYFSADTPVTLPAGSNASITVAASAGKWQLIGNPSGTTPALVTGADEVFAFDAVAGQYMARHIPAARSGRLGAVTIGRLDNHCAGCDGARPSSYGAARTSYEPCAAAGAHCNSCTADQHAAPRPISNIPVEN